MATADVTETALHGAGVSLTLGTAEGQGATPAAPPVLATASRPVRVAPTIGSTGTRVWGKTHHTL